MSEQELKKDLNCDLQEETGIKTETNTAMTVWLIVSITSFYLSLIFFFMGFIGILVSIGLVFFPMVGLFGIGFTILCFVSGGIFLLLGIGALVAFFCSKKKRESNEIAG